MKIDENKILNIIFIILLILFILIFLILLSFPIISKLDNVMRDDKVIRDFYFNKYFDSILKNRYKDDIIVERISGLCDLNKSNFDRILCVHKLINNKYKYILREMKSISFNYNVVSPSTTYNSGGMCSDYSNLYKQIFNKMNINNKISFVDGHMFNIVYFINGYCLIDMNNLKCVGLG